MTALVHPLPPPINFIMDAPAPAARRSASGRAQMLNGLRKPSQLEIEQHDFIVSCYTS